MKKEFDPNGIILAVLLYVVAPILGWVGLKVALWLTMPDFSGLLN